LKYQLVLYSVVKVLPSCEGGPAKPPAGRVPHWRTFPADVFLMSLDPRDTEKPA
jgi:hypothetical protein